MTIMVPVDSLDEVGIRGVATKAEAEASLARALEINPHFSPLQAPLAQQALAELQAQA